MTKRPTRKKGTSQKTVTRLTPFAPVGEEAKQAAAKAAVAEAPPQRIEQGARRERKPTKEIATLIEKPAADAVPSVPAFEPTPEPAQQEMQVPEAPTSALESEIWALEPLEAAVAG